MADALTLGSLCDGSGGFPLAGMYSGIEPRWASEIEPFPIRVTSRRFPGMKHLGDMRRIHGGEIEAVDIITGGTPCQDLSFSGKREGLHGGKSSLFFEYIRVIREMRESTKGRSPRFIVWENVFGAFSSGKGDDFGRVLTEITRIAQPEAPAVPTPPEGRWSYCDVLVGDGCSRGRRMVDCVQTC